MGEEINISHRQDNSYQNISFTITKSYPDVHP